MGTIVVIKTGGRSFMPCIVFDASGGKRHAGLPLRNAAGKTKRFRCASDAWAYGNMCMQIRKGLPTQ